MRAYRQQLWVLWAELSAAEGPGAQRPEGELPGATRRLCLAPVTDNVIGEVQVWQTTSGTAPCDPALGLFADELLISFTDAAAEDRRPGYRPLSAVSFNGVAFHGLRKIADLGRNGEARGDQLGETLYLLYPSDTRYASYAGRYRDLILTTLVSGSRNLDSVLYVDDMKCNLSPSAVAHENSVYVVYEKLEEAPTAAAPTPRSYGTFIGKIDLGPAPVERLPTTRRGR